MLYSNALRISSLFITGHPSSENAIAPASFRSAISDRRSPKSPCVIAAIAYTLIIPLDFASDKILGLSEETILIGEGFLLGVLFTLLIIKLRKKKQIEHRREDYFNMVYKVLKVGGLLFGIFIPLDKDIYNKDGPPFGVSIKEVMKLAHNKFKVIENTFSDYSIKPRAGREKLIILEKI